jgi:hypothetical protein
MGDSVESSDSSDPTVSKAKVQLLVLEYRHCLIMVSLVNSARRCKGQAGIGEKANGSRSKTSLSQRFNRSSYQIFSNFDLTMLACFVSGRQVASNHGLGEHSHRVCQS